MSEWSEAQLIDSLLTGKDQNYKLAYLMALKAAASGNEQISPPTLFEYCLNALDAADAARKDR